MSGTGGRLARRLPPATGPADRSPASRARRDSAALASRAAGPCARSGRAEEPGPGPGPVRETTRPAVASDVLPAALRVGGAGDPPHEGGQTIVLVERWSANSYSPGRDAPSRTQTPERRSAPPATRGTVWVCGRSACPGPSGTGHEKGTCRQAPNPVWRRVFILPLVAYASLRHQAARLFPMLRSRSAGMGAHPATHATGERDPISPLLQRWPASGHGGGTRLQRSLRPTLVTIHRPKVGVRS